MRRTLSTLLFALGALMIALAALLFVSARVRPAQGLEDLGWIVMALLLVALAGVPFSVGLLMAPEARHRTIVLASLGCLLAAVPAAGFLTAGTTALTAIGVVALALAAAGIARGVRLWRPRPASK